MSTVDEIEELDDTQKGDLLAVMKELSLEFHKIETARDQIKEIIGAAAETFELEKSLLRKVSRFYYKKDISSFESEAAEIKNLYSQIVNG